MAELLAADIYETLFYMQGISAAVLHRMLRAFGTSQPSIQCHARGFRESYGIVHHPLSRCWSDCAFANYDTCWFSNVLAAKGFRCDELRPNGTINLPLSCLTGWVCYLTVADM